MPLQVTIVGCYRPLVQSYNVAEHRLDYIKLGEGREYNYHYNDGVSSGFDKRKFYKRPQAFNFKQPYTFKNFPSPVEQIATNEFQSHVPEQASYVKQESLLPVYESHEKSVHYVPVDYSLPKATAATTSAGGHSQPRPSPPYSGNLAERVIQMIHLRHPSSAHNVSGASGSTGSVVHFPPTGTQYHHQQHPGSYQYFNAHPAPPSYELVRPINNFPPPRPYLAPALTTTKAPYVAPFLLKTSTSTTTTTPVPAVAPGKRPGQAPTVRPPYVAPAVTNDPLLNSVSLANQLKYTSTRPATSNGAAGANSQQPYEPEFDIDIRIDLRDDSA
ncbi:uncharacterized protein LOC131284998 [Anopheles ziemanni]|uniref:uncharacterized protein LOC131262815 n=1 Tax=Anopheles coustani TaxID=139045 RepID=UPI00265B5A3D|nr:uncharacterized protein LOC131262815 [Anopheles coustani]XP_058169841.1 uncharacterized protein LOC131284998 [Anopheles ziemanni]